MKKIVLCMLVVLLVITGCNNTSSSNKSLKSEIKYNEYIINNNKMIVVLKNTSDKVVDIELGVTYYDKNKNELGSNSSILYAVTDEEVVIDLGSVEKEYETYSIYVNTSLSKYKTISDVEIKQEDTGSLITVMVDNKNTYDVNINMGVVFFNNNSIVGYDYIVDKVKASDVLNTAIYYPNESIKNIEFDNYKFYVNSIYKN